MSWPGARSRLDPAIAAAILLVAADFDVAPSSIMYRTRSSTGRRAVLARQVAEYLCSVGLDRSARRVALAFGRNRAGVEHSLRLVEDWRSNRGFDARMDALTERLSLSA